MDEQIQQQQQPDPQPDRRECPMRKYAAPALLASILLGGLYHLAKK